MMHGWSWREIIPQMAANENLRQNHSAAGAEPAEAAANGVVHRSPPFGPVGAGSVARRSGRAPYVQCTGSGSRGSSANTVSKPPQPQPTSTPPSQDPAVSRPAPV